MLRVPTFLHLGQTESGDGYPARGDISEASCGNNLRLAKSIFRQAAVATPSVDGVYEAVSSLSPDNLDETSLSPDAFGDGC